MPLFPWRRYGRRRDSGRCLPRPPAAADRSRCGRTTSATSAATRPPTVDTVAVAALYRADGLDRLTAADVDVLRPLGLHTVIDLRSAGEIDERVGSRSRPTRSTFHHLAGDRHDAPQRRRRGPQDLHGGRRRPVAGRRVPRRRLPAHAHAGGERLADGLRLLAEPDDAAARCSTARRARTAPGCSPALLLSGLGVPDDQVVEDYALSGGAFERHPARGPTSTSRSWSSGWTASRRRCMGAEPDAMRARARSSSATSTVGARGVRRARSASTTHICPSAPPRSLG